MEIMSANGGFKRKSFGMDFNEAKCISLGFFVCVFLFWFYRKALYPKEIFFHYVGNNEFEIVKQNASVDSYDVFFNP